MRARATEITFGYWVRQKTFPSFYFVARWFIALALHLLTFGLLTFGLFAIRLLEFCHSVIGLLAFSVLAFGL